MRIKLASAYATHTVGASSIGDAPLPMLRSRIAMSGVSQRSSGRVAGLIAIANRPAAALERVEPGHWEGDLLVEPPTHRRSSLWSSESRGARPWDTCPGQGTTRPVSATPSWLRSHLCQPICGGHSPGGQTSIVGQRAEVGLNARPENDLGGLYPTLPWRVVRTDHSMIAR